MEKKRFELVVEEHILVSYVVQAKNEEEAKQNLEQGIYDNYWQKDWKIAEYKDIKELAD